jgi:hypothetical protein
VPVEQSTISLPLRRAAFSGAEYSKETDELDMPHFPITRADTAIFPVDKSAGLAPTRHIPNNPRISRLRIRVLPRKLA